MRATWDHDGFRTRVQAALDAFLDEQAERLGPLGRDAARLVAEARTSVSGGKMFRASFCWWGHQAVAPPVDEDAVVRACASLELLHASALVHDDYMDASDSRRGRPSTHRAFEREHRDAGWRGQPGQYGASAAILLGDQAGGVRTQRPQPLGLLVEEGVERRLDAVPEAVMVPRRTHGADPRPGAENWVGDPLPNLESGRGLRTGTKHARDPRAR